VRCLPGTALILEPGDVMVALRGSGVRVLYVTATGDTLTARLRGGPGQRELAICVLETISITVTSPTTWFAIASRIACLP
jgi:hypothetical protein